MASCQVPTSSSDCRVFLSLDQILHQHTAKRAPAGVIWLFACSFLVSLIKLLCSHFESNRAIYAQL